MALNCPITSQVKGYPFEVPVPDGFDVSGVVLADRMKCVDWRAKNAVLIAAGPPGLVSAVYSRLRTLLPGE